MAVAEPANYRSETPSAPPEGLELLERRHVAHMLGVSVQYVTKLDRRDLIPGSVKGLSGTGRGRRFVRSRIESWIAAGCPRPARRG